MGISVVTNTAANLLEEDLHLDTPFMESGFTSAMAVQYRMILNGELAVNLPATLMFDHPNMRSIGHYIVDLSRSRLSFDLCLLTICPLCPAAVSGGSPVRSCWPCDGQPLFFAVFSNRRRFCAVFSLWELEKDTMQFPCGPDIVYISDGTLRTCR